jgi:Uma2 family endonuclease
VTEVLGMAVAIKRHRFTVDEYYRMAETGILAPGQRVELIEGEIVDMTPIGRRHMACVDRLTRDFVTALGDRAIVRVQGALRLHEHSEPEPDLVLLRPRADFYAEQDAGPDDTLLVIEVADTSEHYDRQVKVPLYARAGIPEVWLVDLTAGSVTAYREPGATGYAQAIVATGNVELSALAFPELTLTAARILG